LVPFACVPLIATSYNSVLGRACYACKEMPMAVVSSTIAVVVNVILSATLLPHLGARGLLLSNGIAGLLLMVFQLMLLWRLIGGFDWKPLLWSFVRIAVASIAMAAVLVWMRSLGIASGSTQLSRSLGLVTLLTLGAIAYAVASRALGLEELAMVVRKIKEKLAPKALTPATSDVAPVA
jgi:peptidoglycan biosynthesis protein MviN/MurJ (putative lipid II flippase)